MNKIENVIDKITEKINIIKQSDDYAWDSKFILCSELSKIINILNGYVKRKQDVLDYVLTEVKHREFKNETRMKYTPEQREEISFLLKHLYCYVQQQMIDELTLKKNLDVAD